MNLLPRGQVVDDLREKIKTYIDRVNDLGFHRGGIPGGQRRPSKATEAHAYLELTKALMRAIPFDWHTEGDPTQRDDYFAVIEDSMNGKRRLSMLYYSDTVHTWYEDGCYLSENETVVAWSPKPSSKELGGQ